jgi:membrane associated rhomboid family serine protease
MTPWVVRLITANLILFFVSAASPLVFQRLALVPLAVVTRPWTVVTYMFLHAGIAHLLFNMIGLFFFGPRLEARLGSRDFLKLYFYSGLGGALFSLIFAPYAAVVGASGAVFGILLGFALYWPRENIYIWGVLPIQARWLALFLVFVSLYSGISGSNTGVAHFAHLGGLGAGFAYLRWRDRSRRKRVVEKANSFYAAPGVRDQEARERWESIPLDHLHELNRSEVEALLERVRTLGVRSLTQTERDFLDRMVPQAREPR